jgi:MarR family transcriptional regulator, organic hydroperoxide resistance regulator
MAGLSLSEFGDKVAEVIPVIAREFVKQQAAEFLKTRITMPQFIVLELLSMRGESNMTDLANTLDVTTAAMTGIIDRLVKGGYAVRAHDDEDRRIVKADLTPKGSKIVKTMVETRKKLTIKLFGNLSQEEREQYLKILTRVHEELVKTSGGA